LRSSHESFHQPRRVIGMIRATRAGGGEEGFTLAVFKRFLEVRSSCRRSVSTRVSSERSTDAGNPAVRAALAMSKWSRRGTIMARDAYVAWA
jgi:hypothetical protein